MRQKIIEYLMYIIFAIILIGTLTFGIICYKFISVIENGGVKEMIEHTINGERK